jgi:hypothetical protein
LAAAEKRATQKFNEGYDTGFSQAKAALTPEPGNGEAR